MIGILIMTILALILGVFLVIIADKTEKPDYLKYLPGYNCGVCGFGSCKGMSDAMEKDITCYKKCKLLKGEALEKMEQMVDKTFDK